ncbi:hypothetical protein BKA70DRAFT_9226 [Coprinopsis sp. MPI-PUGE-AT-0042]|nr:hypothetical protein BKA70DRAFT_9226 [Coprinopsis sp. MPI-PUGE-AT-0042]
MPTTRRQSGALSKAGASEAMYKDASSDSDFSDEELEYQPRKSSKKTTAAPSAKRQKVANTSGDVTAAAAGDVNGSKPVKKRRGKDLSLLVTMPMDIMFEILSQLSPKDLVNVSQTNKLFHKTLAAPNAKTVWMAAREQASNAPEPPEGYSETRWASLLFKSHCQCCGVKGITKVDWMLRRRVCTWCKKRHLVYTGKFASKYPNYDKKIMDYALYTNVGGWAHGYPSNSRYYWDEDLEEIHTKWSTVKSNAHNGLIGAKEAFTAWKEEREEFVEQAVKLSLTYAKWHASDSGANKSTAANNRALRLAAVKKRFEEAGYNTQDIDSALKLYTPGIETGVPNVTNAVWTKLRPKLEPLVIDAVNRRLDKEMRAIVQPRLETLKAVYQSSLSHLRPSQKRLQPAYQSLRRFPAVASLIDADKDVVVRAEDFEPLMKDVPQYIDEYWADLRAGATATIPTSDATTSSDPFSLARYWFKCGALTSYTSSSHYSEYRIERVCSVKAILGWPRVQLHLSKGCDHQSYESGVVAQHVLEQKCPIALDEATSSAAQTLITLAGLDVATATIEDMDLNEARFVCDSCSQRSMYDVLDWRQAVTRPCPSHSYFSKTSTWRLATQDERTNARKVGSLAQSGVWLCDHCEALPPSPMVAARDHLRITHGINAPDLTKDLYIDEIARERVRPSSYQRPPPQRQITTNTSTKANVQCLQCPLSASRRFILGGVRAHLKDKHGVQNPTEGVHYKVDNSK